MREPVKLFDGVAGGDAVDCWSASLGAGVGAAAPVAWSGSYMVPARASSGRMVGCNQISRTVRQRRARPAPQQRSDQATTTDGHLLHRTLAPFVYKVVSEASLSKESPFPTSYHALSCSGTPSISSHTAAANELPHALQGNAEQGGSGPADSSRGRRGLHPCKAELQHGRLSRLSAPPRDL